MPFASLSVTGNLSCAIIRYVVASGLHMLAYAYAYAPIAQRVLAAGLNAVVAAAQECEALVAVPIAGFGL